VGAGNVTVAALSKIVAHVSSTQFLELLEALVWRDPGRVIATMDELEDSGISMQVVAEKVAGMARHAFVVRDVGTETIDFKALGFDDEETRRLAEIALRAAPSDLNRIFRTITRARTELDGSMVDRYVVENYCLEWCLDPGILFQASPVRHQSHGQSPSAPMISPTKTVANLRESLHAQAAKPAAKPAATPAEKPLSHQPPLQPQQHVAPVAAAAPVQTVTAATHAQPEQPAPKTTPSLPATWRELVDVWRTRHPLQAKRLEDVHPVVYTSDRIELVVPTDSFLSAALLKPEEQRKLKDAFKDLFGYTGGIFFAAKKSGATANSTSEVALPDTVSTEKQRENSVRREQVIVDAQNNPVTKDAMSLFNATIESIEMNT
jgi:DNA polymerase III gamma/tau subunit